jgi:hypothetical protein
VPAPAQEGLGVAAFNNICLHICVISHISLHLAGIWRWSQGCISLAASSSCKQLTTPTWSALMGAIASYSHADKRSKKNAQITAKWGCQPRRKSSSVSGVGFQSGSFLSCALLFGGLDDFIDLLSFRGAARMLSIRACRTLCARVAFLINDLE